MYERNTTSFGDARRTGLYKNIYLSDTRQVSRLRSIGYAVRETRLAYRDANHQGIEVEPGRQVGCQLRLDNWPTIERAWLSGHADRIFAA